jgi:NADPH:quinone reductase-like Zn-dependent oxidoreductase
MKTNMRAIRAEQFSGYEGLKLVELPKPAVADGKVLLRMRAAGVTPLDYTILSGKFHNSKAPLVLGNEGAGVVEEGGGTEFPAGSRVMSGRTEGGPLPDSRQYRRRERRRYSRRVSHRRGGSYPGGFSRRQDCSVTSNRRLDRQCSDTISARLGRKACHV